MKRVAIYTFWERQGIVRDYVFYYLDALKTVSERVIVVVNGTICEDNRLQLIERGIEVLVRENEGLDFSAWKYALETITYERLSDYDELILCNCSVYGPVYPFGEMFDRMAQDDCDFWGITCVPEDREAFLIKDDKSSYIKEHLQSYFLVFRKQVLVSQAFFAWWKDLKQSRSFWEEVAEHEMKFTPYLQAHGFKKSSLYQSVWKWNPTLYEPLAMLKVRVPFVKRKLFSIHHNKLIDKISIDTLSFVDEKSPYDVNLIYEDLKGIGAKASLDYKLKNQGLVNLFFNLNVCRYQLLSIFSSKYKDKFEALKRIS